MSDVLVESMHGMGDNFHQRALVKHLMKTERVVLPTVWPQIYWDMVGEKLILTKANCNLRTQAKNADRSTDLFTRVENPYPHARRLKIWYPPNLVRSEGSVLGAMLKQAGIPNANPDFRMHHIPKQWSDKAMVWIKGWGANKPLMIYRPLVDRPKEWTGCPARNPDALAYSALANSIKDKYFVVSIADLEKDREWISGGDIDADVKLHKGQLDIETMIGIFAMASLVFASPGFAVVLAQTVGTPVVCTFGGYEKASSFSVGAKYTPYLGIEPVKPCDCFQHDHACDKRINLAKATDQLNEFVSRLER